MPKDVSDLVLPMGCTMHMDGSVLSSIVKIAFLFGVFGMEFTGVGTYAMAIAVAILSAFVLSGAPGGGLVGEMLIVSMFVHGYAARILWSLAVVGLIVIYFRMLSRNVYRRQQENGAYLRQKYKITSAWRGAVDRWHQRHDYRFFKCPSCRTRLRVPRGKGKINIVCRKCGTSFQRKT